MHLPGRNAHDKLLFPVALTLRLGSGHPFSGFTDAELRAYDKFWDSVSVERTLLDDRYQKGMEEGMEKGRAEGKYEANTEIAQRLLAMGLSAEQVAKATQLPLEIIKNLSNS